MPKVTTKEKDVPKEQKEIVAALNQIVEHELAGMVRCPPLELT